MCSFETKWNNIESKWNQITTNPNGENISNLPELTPYQANTKIYKAAIDGSVESTSSVKYFKWLATPKVDSQTQTTTTSKQNTAQYTIQQAIDNAKNQIQNSVNKVLDTPIQANPTTPPTESNNKGVADFINKLPDLSR